MNEWGGWVEGGGVGIMTQTWGSMKGKTGKWLREVGIMTWTLTHECNYCI